jgi:hypothetical protein
MKNPDVIFANAFMWIQVALGRKPKELQSMYNMSRALVSEYIRITFPYKFRLTFLSVCVEWRKFHVHLQTKKTMLKVTLMHGVYANY